MSLQVTLTPAETGVASDVTDYLKDGAFKLGRSLGGEGATCDFGLVNYPGIVSMAEVLATWEGDPIYRGLVVYRRRQSAGSETFIAPQCMDALSRFQRRIVAQTYTDTTGADIITDLLATYAPDVTPAVSGLTAPLDMVFNYTHLLEALQRVADAMGAYWQLEPGSIFRCFPDYYDGSSVTTFDPSNILGDSFQDEVANPRFSNRVWVIGARQAATNFKTQLFSGASDVYPLAYEPNYTEVRVNGGALKDVKLKENADADTEFVVDKKRKAIESRISLVSTDEVQIRYRPTVEIVDYFDDQASVATYGLYETVIKDRTITDKTAARQRGRAAVRRAATQQPLFTWQSDLWQVYPGQRCRVVYPQFSVDQYCRLTDIDVTFQFLGHKWQVTASLRGEGL